MPPHATPRVSSRKQPRQARSAELVSAILDAAVQVLESEGAQRFTTARVAERAGVSVGSLYQYFPNKAAILFRLQSDEWRRTSAMLGDILSDESVPAFVRLRRLVNAFIQSECEEARIRGALDDAAPLYRDAPEAQKVHAASTRIFHAFIDGLLPDATSRKRSIVADLTKTTLKAAGAHFSSIPRTAEEIAVYADAVADMFCAYLEREADNIVSGPQEAKI